jgi:2,3-bisphosphoglycerate-dependent phosphoglycerate mutase
MCCRAESLADVSTRLLPYWYDVIVPDLCAGGCVLVVSHGNTLRALVKHLESIPDDRIAELELPTGIPLVYQLGPGLRSDGPGGQYLDQHAAREHRAITYRPMTDPEEVRYEQQAWR